MTEAQHSPIDGKYDVKINGQGYRVDPDSYEEIPQETSIPAQAAWQGKSVDNLSYYWREQITDWGEGQGQKWANKQTSSPAKYWSGYGIDVVSTYGQVAPGIKGNNEGSADCTNIYAASVGLGYIHAIGDYAGATYKRLYTVDPSGGWTSGTAPSTMGNPLYSTCDGQYLYASYATSGICTGAATGGLGLWNTVTSVTKMEPINGTLYGVGNTNLYALASGAASTVIDNMGTGWVANCLCKHDGKVYFGGYSGSGVDDYVSIIKLYDGNTDNVTKVIVDNFPNGFKLTELFSYEGLLRAWGSINKEGHLFQIANDGTWEEIADYGVEGGSLDYGISGVAGFKNLLAFHYPHYGIAFHNAERGGISIQTRTVASVASLDVVPRSSVLHYRGNWYWLGNYEISGRRLYSTRLPSGAGNNYSYLATSGASLSTSLYNFNVPYMPKNISVIEMYHGDLTMPASASTWPSYANNIRLLYTIDEGTAYTPLSRKQKSLFDFEIGETWAVSNCSTTVTGAYNGTYCLGTTASGACAATRVVSLDLGTGYKPDDYISFWARNATGGTDATMTLVFNYTGGAYTWNGGLDGYSSIGVDWHKQYIRKDRFTNSTSIDNWKNITSVSITIYAPTTNQIKLDYFNLESATLFDVGNILCKSIGLKIEWDIIERLINPSTMFCPVFDISIFGVPIPFTAGKRRWRFNVYCHDRVKLHGQEQSEPKSGYQLFKHLWDTSQLSKFTFNGLDYNEDGRTDYVCIIEQGTPRRLKPVTNPTDGSIEQSVEVIIREVGI